MNLNEQQISEEAVLVHRAQAGESEAFDRLTARYRGMVLTQAFLRTGRLDDAEDLTQEVLAKAWRSISSLQAPDAFVAWLRAITANACRSWFRRAPWPASFEEMREELPASIAELPLTIVLAHERQRALREALIALPELNCRALLLHVLGGYSYAEIAVLLEIPLTTVEGRIYRARQQLRRLLLDEEAILKPTNR